jgi:hypothetical protein
MNNELLTYCDAVNWFNARIAPAEPDGSNAFILLLKDADVAVADEV